MSSFSRLSLEEFGAAPPKDVEAKTEAAPAIDTTEIYETGYQAGWDDCLERTKHDQTHIAEALGKRLSDAHLTVDHARSEILAELKPLRADIVQKLLPALAQSGFRQRLLDEVVALAQDAAQAEIEIRVSHEELNAVTTLLEAHPDTPQVKLSADAALGLTQAHLKLGSTGRSIDILHVVDGIETAFDAVLSDDRPTNLTDEKDVLNG